MSVEMVSPSQFEAMMGTYLEREREKDRFYPRQVNGEYKKAQCEDFSEMLMYRALRGLNHELIAICAHMGRIMLNAEPMFKRHARFMGGFVDGMPHVSDAKNRMMLEYGHLRDNRASVLYMVNPMRERIKKLIVSIKAFPIDWGRAEYEDSLGGMMDDLRTLQNTVYELGQPRLFNCYTVSASWAFEEYWKKWRNFTDDEKAVELGEFSKGALAATQRANHYRELSEDYKESNQLFIKLNKELKDNAHDAKQEYHAKISSGLYPVVSDAGHTEYCQLQPSADGNFILPVSRELIKQLGKSANGMLRVSIFNGGLIVKMADNNE